MDGHERTGAKQEGEEEKEKAQEIQVQGRADGGSKSVKKFEQYG